MLDGCIILPLGFNPPFHGSQDVEVGMQTFLSNHEGVIGVLAGFDRMARRVNPLLSRRNPLKLDLRGYSWTMHQSEYATDFMFKDRQSLQAIYPSLVKHAITEFSSTDVMRFLGRRTNSQFKGEVISDIKTRIEGTRIKHRVEENSLKMGDLVGQRYFVFGHELS